jgi:hypothetical protein
MSESTIQEQLIARAMKDPAFRQALLSTPKEVLAREYNIHLPEDVAVRVLEEPRKTLTLVLPTREEGALELSDAELEAISGGIGGVNWFTKDCAPTQFCLPPLTFQV